MGWILDSLTILGLAVAAMIIATASTGSAHAGAIAAGATGVACGLWFAIQGLRDELRQDQ